MAGIFANVESDITKLKQLKEQIDEVKKALKSINVKVDIDIAKGMEAQLKNLTTQYDALVQKVSQAEGKIIASTQRINQAAEKIVKAQEQLAKATGAQQQTGNATGNNTAANQAETASVQAQAKAYDDLADEIDAVMGTRSQNIRRMIEEQNAIRLINEEIKKLTKYQGENSTLSSSQQRRLEQLNASLLQHKTALSELRQSLNNSFKLDNSAATSMNALSQSLGRMRMAYRELTEEERKSPFGQELLASIQQADAKIKQLDATIGNHQRNVGNYASGWNGLNMSVQQIVRELPAATMGLNMFFLAISNNLPILTDEIKRAREANEQLKKSGQSTVPVWKQLVSSIFSWQTAMMVAITVLSMYGKDIANWISGLFGADEAHKRLNESVKEFNSLVGESQAKAKLLFETIKKAGEGTQGRVDAIKQFNDEYGKYYSNMLSEKSSLLEIEKAYKQVNKALMENAALKAQQSAIDKTLESAIKEQSETLMKIQRSVGTQNARPVTETVMSWTEEYMQAGMKWEQAFGDIAENIRKKVGKLPDDFYTALEDYVKSVYESSREIQNIQDKYNPFFNKEKANKAVVQNRDYWENQRKLLVEQLNALSDLEAKGEKGIKIKLSIQDIDNKLKSFDSSSQAKTYNGINSQQGKIDDMLPQQGKIDDMLRKQAQARISQQIDLENQVAQARIDAMADGAEKERSQRELDNKMELQDIEQQKRDYIQSVIQSQKEIFDAQEELKAKQDTSYKKKTFDASSVKVDTSSYDELFALTQSRQVSDQWDKEEQAWNEYLQRYGTFQQKRLAITQEYQQKIAAATTEGEKLTLQKQMEEALSDTNMDELKESINWELVFSDLENVSKQSLQKIKKQLSDFKDSAEYKEMTVDQKQVIDEALNNIQSAIIDKGGLLGDLPAQLEELRKAQEELNNAQDEYNRALAEGTDEQKKAATQKLNKAQHGVSNAQKNVEQSTKKTTDNFLTLADAITQLGGSSEMTLTQVGQLAGSIADSFAEAGSKIGGIIGAIFSLLDQIGKQGLDGFLENVFSSVGSALYGVFDTLLGWTGINFGGESDPHLEEDLERLAISNQELEKALNNLSEKMDESSVAEASDIYEVQKENIEKQMANTWESMWRSLNASSSGFMGIGGSHSTNYKINHGMTAEDWKAISDAVGKSVTDASDFFSLTSEEMWKAANGATTEYSKLKELADDGYKDAAQYMDDYIGYWQELEELQDEYNEKLTSVSFDTIQSDFRNAILGMTDDSEAFAENFEKLMQQAVLESMMTNTYDKQLRKWYESFSSYMEGGELTKGEQEALRKDWQDIVDKASEEWKMWQETMGWDTSSSAQQQQSSRGSGFETMTQDQASELSGRFTAVHEGELRIESAVGQQTLAITDIKGSISDLVAQARLNYSVGDEVRTILAQSYIELQGINENTGAIVKPIQQMQKDMEEVKRNTSRL